MVISNSFANIQWVDIFQWIQKMNVYCTFNDNKLLIYKKMVYDSQNEQINWSKKVLIAQSEQKMVKKINEINKFEKEAIQAIGSYKQIWNVLQMFQLRLINTLFSIMNEAHPPFYLFFNYIFCWNNTANNFSYKNMKKLSEICFYSPSILVIFDNLWTRN